MNKKQKRFFVFGGAFAIASGAVLLTLTALNGSITYFYTPGDLIALDEAPKSTLRLGGLVAAGSIQYADGRAADDTIVSFKVTDGEATINVSYAGILPDLFREGQGVVVQGRLTKEGHLRANNVLAKHDENYMPKEVADALKEKGVWKDPGSQY